MRDLRSTGTTLLCGGCAALALGLAPCAGDDGQAERVAFERRANAVCAGAITEMDAVVGRALTRGLASLGDQPPEAADLQQLYAGLVAPSRRAETLVARMLDDLRALSPPADRSAEYAALWDDIETTLARSRADIVEAAGDPSFAVKLWRTEVSPFAPVDARARALGLPACTPDT